MLGPTASSRSPAPRDARDGRPTRVRQDKSPTEFVPVPVRRPREQVEHQLRDAILSGNLSVGTRLPAEAELASEFLVSRTTVREALRSLVTAGLIDKVPGSRGGTFVRSIDHLSLADSLHETIQSLVKLGTIDITDAVQVHRLLEIPAVRLAAENRSDADLAVMDEIIGALSATTLDDPSIPELDLKLHYQIGLASGNCVLAAFIKALHRVGEPVRRLRLTPEVARESHRQHRALVEAIRQSDPGAAAEILSHHMTYWREHSR
jgi:GntR family transcriptional regulator, transcriptional repressor for pyruvate dehydrogenase complex